MNCVILQIQKKSNGIKGSPWTAGALSWACLVGSARERVKGLDPAHREAACLWAGLGTSRARDAVPRRIPESFFPGRRERPPGGWRSGESGLGATNGTSGTINTQSSAVLAPGLRAGGLKAGLSPGLTAHRLLSVAAFEGRLGYSRKSSVPRLWQRVCFHRTPTPTPTVEAGIEGLESGLTAHRVDNLPLSPWAAQGEGQLPTSAESGLSALSLKR